LPKNIYVLNITVILVYTSNAIDFFSQAIYWIWKVFWTLLAEKSFLNLVKLTEIRLYSTYSEWFGIKWNSVWFQNQSEKCNYNPNCVCFDEARKMFLCVYWTPAVNVTIFRLIYRTAVRLIAVSFPVWQLHL